MRPSRSVRSWTSNQRAARSMTMTAGQGTPCRPDPTLLGADPGGELTRVDGVGSLFGAERPQGPGQCVAAGRQQQQTGQSRARYGFHGRCGRSPTTLSAEPDPPGDAVRGDRTGPGKVLCTNLPPGIESMAVGGPARVDRIRCVVVGRPSPDDARLEASRRGDPAKHGPTGRDMPRNHFLARQCARRWGSAVVSDSADPGPFENTR